MRCHKNESKNKNYKIIATRAVQFPRGRNAEMPCRRCAYDTLNHNKTSSRSKSKSCLYAAKTNMHTHCMHFKVKIILTNVNSSFS